MQRLSIARAMMHDPQVLFLDEPSAGLDPQTRILLWEIIREYNQPGKLFCGPRTIWRKQTALCQRLAIVDHGRVIALGTPGELKRSSPEGFLVAAAVRQEDGGPAAAHADAGRSPRGARIRFGRSCKVEPRRGSKSNSAMLATAATRLVITFLPPWISLNRKVLVDIPEPAGLNKHAPEPKAGWSNVTGKF